MDRQGLSGGEPTFARPPNCCITARRPPRPLADEARTLLKMQPRAEATVRAGVKAAIVVSNAQSAQRSGPAWPPEAGRRTTGLREEFLPRPTDRIYKAFRWWLGKSQEMFAQFPVGGAKMAGGRSWSR